MKEVILENAVYSTEDLEEILGITKRTLGEIIKNEELIPIVFGNKYRFLGSEILTFLKWKMEKK